MHGNPLKPMVQVTDSVFQGLCTPRQVTDSIFQGLCNPRQDALVKLLGKNIGFHTMRDKVLII